MLNKQLENVENSVLFYLEFKIDNKIYFQTLIIKLSIYLLSGDFIHNFRRNLQTSREIIIIKKLFFNHLFVLSYE